MFYKALQKKQNNKKAFTLIELIVVIAIIGVLVAILVPTMNNFVTQARQSTADANARTIYSVAQAEATFGMTNGETYDAGTLKTAILPQLNGMEGDFTLTVVAGMVTQVDYSLGSNNVYGGYPNAYDGPA